MTLYVFFLFFITFIAIFYKLVKVNIYRSVLFYTYIFTLSLFSGLRYHTGWDYEAYDYFITQLPSIFSSNPLEYNPFYFEPVFVLFSSLIKSTGLSVYLVLSFITVAISLISARKILGKEVAIFMVLYLYFGYFHNFSIVRQGLVAALFLFLIIPFINGRWILSLIGIIFAIFIHKSAIFLIFVMVYYRVFRNQPVVPILLMLIVGPVFVSFPFLSSLVSHLSPNIGTILGDKVASYLAAENLTYKVGWSLKYIEMLAIVVVSLIPPVWRRGCDIYGKYYSAFVFMSVTGVSVYSFLNDYSIIYERLFVYFETSIAILIAMLIAILFKRLILFLIILSSMYVFVRYERILYHSENFERLGVEMGHLERFENYCSILNKGVCSR